VRRAVATVAQTGARHGHDPNFVLECSPPAWRFEYQSCKVVAECRKHGLVLTYPTFALNAVMNTPSDSLNAAPAPVMLRVYEGESIGSTAFFRNRPLLHTLSGLIATSGRSRLDVLIHACSVGVEPYSLAMFMRLAGLDRSVRVRIRATDVNRAFLDAAKEGIYPAAVMSGLSERERVFFEAVDNDCVRVIDEVRQSVDFLPAASFVDFQPEDRFDIVFVLNALTYVTPEQQAESVSRIASYNDWLLVASAFHPDTIDSDLATADYLPVETNAELIHEAWVERRRAVAPHPGSREYSWVLPPFRHDREFLARQCAIFRKASIARSSASSGS
jgi:hypothetical protein